MYAKKNQPMNRALVQCLKIVHDYLKFSERIATFDPNSPIWEAVYFADMSRGLRSMQRVLNDPRWDYNYRRPLDELKLLPIASDPMPPNVQAVLNRVIHILENAQPSYRFPLAA